MIGVYNIGSVDDRVISNRCPLEISKRNPIVVRSEARVDTQAVKEICKLGGRNQIRDLSATREYCQQAK